MVKLNHTLFQPLSTDRRERTHVTYVTFHAKKMPASCGCFFKKIFKHLNGTKSYEKVNDRNSLLKDLNTNFTSFLETVFNHHININIKKNFTE